MTKRLQVLLDDEELVEIQRAAKRGRVSVAQWVRDALRQARASDGPLPTDAKLAAVRRAVRHAFPTGSPAEMRQEIERGYTRELPE